MNERLEALATLASTSPSSPAWGDTGLHNSSQKTDENPFSAHGSNGDTPASISSGSTAAAPIRSHPLLPASNLIQTPHNGNLSHWQQAPQQGGRGTNPSVLSSSNLALLMGMQQQQQQAKTQPQADPLALLQQQLSYHRYNMNNQSGNQMAAGIGDRTVQQANSASLEPHQALALSLALQAHQRFQQNGKSPIGTFCRLSRPLRPIAGCPLRRLEGFVLRPSSLMISMTRNVYRHKRQMAVHSAPARTFVSIASDVFASCLFMTTPTSDV
jgi:hypothetical protein